MIEREVGEVQAWVRHAVLGLGLCPFAKGPHARGQVRWVGTAAEHPEALLACLLDELRLIAAEPPERIETTLLIHPRVLTDFDDYNDFLAVADEALVALDLEGVIQIASFHPQYRFAGTEPGDLGNATNRSPHPVLQLLREDSVERALDAFPEPDRIFEANIATLERLGAAGWEELQRRCRDDAARVPSDDGPG